MDAVFLEPLSAEAPLALKAVVRRVPRPALTGMPQGMMLMRTVATSVCGSDLWGRCGGSAEEHAWRGVIPHFHSKKGAVGGSGHEVLAEVVAAVAPCTRVPGELVLCMTTNYLQGVDSVREMFEQRTGVSADALPPQGSFCEYFLSYDALSIPVPATPPPGRGGALLPTPAPHRLWYVAAQPLGTVLHAVAKLPSLVGKTVAIVGQGQNGLLMTQVLVNMGVCRAVICVDRIPHRLTVAKAMGATGVVLNDATTVPEGIRVVRRGIRACIGGDADQVDVSIEMVGHHADTLDIAAGATKADGTVLIFGLPPCPTHSQMTIHFADFARNVRYITSHAPPMATFAQAMAMLHSGAVDVSRIFSHTFPYTVRRGIRYGGGVPRQCGEDADHVRWA